METIDEPVNIRAEFHMPPHCRVDLMNLRTPLYDKLVTFGIISDSNPSIVVPMDGSRVLYDKENPRKGITTFFFLSAIYQPNIIQIHTASYNKSCILYSYRRLHTR